MDVWASLSEVTPSKRDELVYDIEPFRAAVRKGDWKLVWQATLPSQVELFNLAQDPGEKANLADKNPQKVVELQKRIEALVSEAAPPLILTEALGAVKLMLFGSVALPDEEKILERQP
jgi:arylsulfatase A-like enzyme